MWKIGKTNLFPLHVQIQRFVHKESTAMKTSQDLTMVLGLMEIYKSMMAADQLNHHFKKNLLHKLVG